MFRFDVAILGGGLAGLTLARQLQIEAPHVRTLVCEKRRHPVREAAFKVGESSVEIGAHYFNQIVDLRALLTSDHLPKLGLRYFFPHDGNRNIASRVELGPSMFPPVPSFQLDRGRLENSLLKMARDGGATVLDATTVRRIDLGTPHRIVIDAEGGSRVAEARWIADTSGRAGLLKRQLGLAQPVRHAANACWFRFPTRLRVDDWSESIAWQRRIPTRERWLSTNHLMGVGYWVWLIPLGSGSTSVGIVADPALHPFNRMNRFSRALDWLREFEPQCAGVVEAHAPQLEDFLALQHFAHGCGRVFSADRWVMSGESGVFTDPFYSPGSDFIAMGNDFSVDLITRDLKGEDIRERAETFNTTHLRLFEAFLRLYDGQYPLMGKPQVMIAKVAWDNAAYWSVTALLFFQRRLRRPEFMASIEPLLRKYFVLHARMQQLFNAWGKSDDGTYAGGRCSVMDIERLRTLQAGLADALVDDATLRDRLERNYAWLEQFARAWQEVAMRVDPSLGRFVAVSASDDATAVASADKVDLAPLQLTAPVSA